jgi:hypothetical protein
MAKSTPSLALEVGQFALILGRSVSVDHASAWVALKGPWRRACARVGSREGDGLSGCDPDASITKRRVQDAVNRNGRPQPQTPNKFWEAGKDLQGWPVGDDAGTGTRSRGEGRAGGRLGTRVVGGLRIAVLLAFFGVGGAWHMEGRMEYVKSTWQASGSVSVDHASAWVALKGPWRQACARVGGREGDGLSGCDPDASIT